MRKVISIIIFTPVALLVLAACSSGDGEASVNGNIVSQESITVPNGASIQVQIHVTVKPDTPPGTVTNVAEVTSDTDDTAARATARRTGAEVV